MANNSRQRPTNEPSPNFTDSGRQLPGLDRQITENTGNLSLTDSHAVYTGSSHWVSILEDVGCLSGKSVRVRSLTLLFPDPTSQR
jgi:hypothetical protein